MQALSNYEDLVGHALKVLTKSMIVWFETVVPSLLTPPKTVDDWAFDVRHEIRNDKFLCGMGKMENCVCVCVFFFFLFLVKP